MQYLLLIYRTEPAWAGLPADEVAALRAEYAQLTADLKASGHHCGDARLQAAPTAKTVRVRGGKTMTTDGPFAETKEHLGGYYLVEAKDLDEAVQLAARVPGARYGSIEVRPVIR